MSSNIHPNFKLERRLNPGRRATLNKLLRAKQVAFFPGLCLLINAMTGPSIPFTANAFQTGSLFPTAILFVLFAILSTFCCLFIVESMQAIPGNKHFQGQIEFATLVNFYFGDTLHILAQIFLYWCVESNAIQCIAFSAQTLDNVLLEIAKKTCGISLKGAICIGSKLDPTLSSPFGDEFMFITLGYIVLILLVVPLAYINLDDNIEVQVASFVLSLAMLSQWIIASALYISVPNTPEKIGKPLTPIPLANASFFGIIGNIMLSLAFTFVVPSWINMKKKNVNTQQTLWTASSLTTILYLFIGIIPAAAFAIPLDGNIMTPLSQFGIPTVLSKISTYLFPIIMLIPSIPVAFLVTQNNLVQNRVTGPRLGYFLAFILPWLCAIPFISGRYLVDFQNWTSCIFVSTSNFIVPILIFLRCLVFRREYNLDRSILTPKQRRLLKEIHSNSRTIRQWVDDGLKKLDFSENSLPHEDDDDISKIRLERKKAYTDPNDSKDTPHHKLEKNDSSKRLLGDFSGRQSESETVHDSILIQPPTPQISIDVIHQIPKMMFPEESEFDNDTDIDEDEENESQLAKFLMEDLADPEREDEERRERLKTISGSDGGFLSASGGFIKRAWTGMTVRNSSMDVPADGRSREGSMELTDIKRDQRKRYNEAILEEDNRLMMGEVGTSSHEDLIIGAGENKKEISFSNLIANTDPTLGSVLEKSVKRPHLASTEQLSHNLTTRFNPPVAIGGTKEEDELRRTRTLPMHPQFVSKTFRSCPSFLTDYVSTRVVALVCLVFCSLVSVGNFVGLVYDTFKS